MSIFKIKYNRLGLYRSLYFLFYPFLSLIFYFDILVFLLLLSAAFSQTTLGFAPAFYFIKWGVLIFFIICEYLILNFISINDYESQKVEIPTSYIFLLLFLIYISITSLYSEDVKISIFKSFTFFFLIFTTLVLIPILARRFSKRKSIIKSVYIFLIIMLVMNVLAFKIYPRAPQSPYMTIRFRGFFENPNTLGMICFVAVPLLLYKYKTAKSTILKFFNLLFILSAIILPIIAASRASLLGIGIVIAVYFYYYYRRLFYFCTILSLVAIFFVLISPVLLELMRLAEDPLSQRDKVWELGLAAWKENFFFGAGYGTTENFTNNKYLFMTKGLTEFVLGKRFNNIYIEILYETGIIGLTLFSTSIGFLMRETYSIVKKTFDEEKVFSVCYFGLLIAVIFQGIFESFILSAGNASSLIFWILTGLVIFENNKRHFLE